MDRDLRQALDRLEEKLDRLLDPESGIYAQLRKHEAEDDSRMRTGRYGLILIAILAGGERVVSLVLHLLS